MAGSGTNRRKNSLSRTEAVTAADIERARKKPRKAKQTKTTAKTTTGRTKSVADSRKRDRLPTPVPKNKNSDEIKAMDPDDPAFKNPQGAKRKRDYSGKADTSKMSFHEVIRLEKQESANRLRAKQRKHEAVVEKLSEETYRDGNGPVSSVLDADGKRNSIYAEDALIAEGKLTLDDWDEQELIRGYRRGRNGRFGDPPKYIPREVQQEAFRRLVRVGERKMRQQYLNIIDELINLATDRTVSDKTRLEAIKEVQNRVVGKTPEMVVTTEAPWQDMLVDSVLPLSEVDALIVPGRVLTDGNDPLPDGGGSTKPVAASVSPAREDPLPSDDGASSDPYGVPLPGSGKKGRTGGGDGTKPKMDTHRPPPSERPTGGQRGDVLPLEAEDWA